MKRALLPFAILTALGSCTAEPPSPPYPAVPPTISQSAVEPLAQPVVSTRQAPEILRSELMQGGFLLGRASSDTVGLSYAGEAVTIAEDGRFFIGFDRDALADVSLSVRYADGSERNVPLSLSSGKWVLQHINAPYRGSARSDAEFERLRDGELAQIAAARKLSTGATGWTQSFIWPVEGRISGWFGAQRVYQGKPGPYHGGLDIARPTGTAFVAPADGTVILAASSPFTLEGYLLMIDHGDGLNSAFLHCSEILVRQGDRVKQGDVIGKVGATGRANGPHLHWGVKWRDARIDPLLLLERPDLQSGG